MNEHLCYIMDTACYPQTIKINQECIQNIFGQNSDYDL